MALVLALLSAVFYGTADFFGGLAARRSSALAATVLAQGAGLVLVAVALPFFPGEPPRWADTLWGVGAGLTGGLGVALLYYGLAVGRVSVVAPVTAVCAITIPVVVAMALGERPGPLAISGIALAVLSVGLISRQGEPAGASPFGAPGSATEGLRPSSCASKSDAASTDWRLSRISDTPLQARASSTTTAAA